jgi:ribose 5-phosphate isomerase A
MSEGLEMAGRSQAETDALKKAAAEYAVDLVKPGMVVGLGAGSTALFAIQKLASLIKLGNLRDILGVPCSSLVERRARRLKIPLTTLNQNPVIDITIDGADEATEKLDLIKGGGGALLREKIVAQASKLEVIVVDDSKLSPMLGTHHTLPIEITGFGLQTQISFLESLGAEAKIRTGPLDLFTTDQGNLILDCDFGPIDNPCELAPILGSRAGIIEHGLFLGLAHMLVIAGPQEIRVVNK